MTKDQPKPEQSPAEQAAASCKKMFGHFAGVTITEIRTLTEKEMKDLQLDDTATSWNPYIAIFCSNGRALIVSADAEGNGPGFLEECETKQVKQKGRPHGG